MLVPRLEILLWCLSFLRLTFGDAIDNGIMGTPSIQCMDSTIQFTFKTAKAFAGRVYVKGRSRDPDCSQNFTRTGLPVSTYVVELGRCGMQRLRSMDPPGMNMIIVLVVSFHPLFVTKVDRAYRLQCLFRPTEPRTVTQALEVSMLPTTPLTGGGDLAQCTYTVRRGRHDGPLLRYATVGEKAVHVWSCSAGMEEIPLGLLVYGCKAMDMGASVTVEILDNRGCIVDPILLSPVMYDMGRALAFADSHVYKYSDTPMISFVCNIRLCSRLGGECAGITPPECHRSFNFAQKLFTLRRERDIVALNDDPMQENLSENPAPIKELGVLANDVMVFDTAVDTAAAVEILHGESQPHNKSTTTKSGTVPTTVEPQLFPEFTNSRIRKELVQSLIANGDMTLDSQVCVNSNIFGIMLASVLISTLLCTVIAVMAFTKLVASVWTDASTPKSEPVKPTSKRFLPARRWWLPVFPTVWSPQNPLRGSAIDAYKDPLPGYFNRIYR